MLALLAAAGRRGGVARRPGGCAVGRRSARDRGEDVAGLCGAGAQGARGGRAGRTSWRLVTPGYVLARSRRVDRRGRGSSGMRRRDATRSPTATPRGATAELGEALGLWRGDALADCRGGGWAAAEAVRLDELRLSTVEDRIDADLMLGQHGVLVGELESLVARHPLRERLWAALMLALYRAGRQADARARLPAGARRARRGAGPGAGRGAAPARSRRARRRPGPGRARRHQPSIGDTELAIPLSRSDRRRIVGGVRRARARARGPERVVEGRRRRVNDGSCWSRASRGSARRRWRPRSRARRSRTARSCCTDAATRTSGSRISRGPRCSPISSAHAPDDVLAAHVDARGNELARLAPDLAAARPAGRASSSDAESERYLLFGAVVDLLDACLGVGADRARAR